MGRHKKHKQSDSAVRRCALCGSVVFPYAQNCVTGATGRVVCEDCLGTSRKILENNRVSEKKQLYSDRMISPQELMQKLDHTIIGQTKAKRAVAIALWKQLLRAAGVTNLPRANLLLYGPTGCGKTALVREAAKIAGLPFICFDATTLTETGYRGRDAEEMVKDLIQGFRDHAKLSCGVVFLDEFDKLAATGGENHAEYSRGTQHAMLKLVEGVSVTHEDVTISTEGLLFIFGGAFTGLTTKKDSRFKQVQSIGFDRPHTSSLSNNNQMISTKDFIAFGMEPELLGRVGQYISLDPLTEKDLKKILLESDLSLYVQYQKFFHGQGLELRFSDQQIDKLVSEAFFRGTGARGLNNLVEQAVEPMLFQIASKKVFQCQCS